MEQYKKEFIEFMVECGVLTFGDFITKSGRKTPFFVNTGNYKTGRQLSKLGDFYAEAIYHHFGTDFNVLFGPAYKGIPLSVAASISLDRNYGMDVCYCSNRKEIKDHGDKGILLGSKLKNEDKVIIIEDVTTAGTSIYETMPIIKSAADIEVKGLIISVDRMEKGQGENTALKELEDTFNFKTCAIVTMREVIDYLSDHKVAGEKIINETIMKRIEEYYQVYGA